MIPRVITDTTITFIAKGRPWMLAKDHPQFLLVKEALMQGEMDEDALVNLVDITVAVSYATGGRARLNEYGLFFDDGFMGNEWTNRAKAAPESLRVLLAEIGDQVRVMGDDDCPDGIYPVGDIDTNDHNNSIMIETEDGFLGFVSNNSIKEVIKGTEDVITEDCDGAVCAIRAA